MKQNNQTNNTRTIEVGKFYLIFDGSRTGHPGSRHRRGPCQTPGRSNKGGRPVSAVYRPQFAGPEGAAAHP